MNVYLFFNGNCREAFDFYADALGGEIVMSTTYADAPADLVVPEGAQDLIMHVTLSALGGVVMGSDNVEGFGPPRTAGSNFAISVSPPDRDAADRIFARITAGGSVDMPMQDAFWGSYFGSGRDRFGVEWMINLNTQGQTDP